MKNINGYNLAGQDYRPIIRGISLQACRNKCESESRCTHFSYQDNQNGGQNTNNCFLKTGKNWKLNKAHHWNNKVHYYSGVKNKYYVVHHKKVVHHNVKPVVHHKIKPVYHHNQQVEIVHYHNHYHHPDREHYLPNDEYYDTYEPNYIYRQPIYQEYYD